MYRSKQRRQMWNVSGIWFNGKTVLWSLFDLSADCNHYPPQAITSLLFIYEMYRFMCAISNCMGVTSLLRATVPSTVHSGALCKHDSLLSLYLRSVQTIEPSFQPAVRSVWLSAENDTLRTPPTRYEWHCSSMCRSCRVQQQHHNTHSGQNSNIIQMFTRNQITKRAPTMEAVSRMHRSPSRPTEASHKWWGDKTREAGPRGWPPTSCSGFSWTTCWLETPSVSWAEESGSRIMISDVLIGRLRMHTWDHCFHKQ